MEIIQGYLSQIKTSEHADGWLEVLADDMAGMTPAEIKMAVTSEAPRKALFADRDAVTMRDIKSAINELTLGMKNPIRDMQNKDKEKIAVHEAGMPSWPGSSRITGSRTAPSSGTRGTGRASAMCCPSRCGNGSSRASRTTGTG